MKRVMSNREQVAALIVWAVSNGSSSAKFTTWAAAAKFAQDMRGKGMLCYTRPVLVRCKDYV